MNRKEKAEVAACAATRTDTPPETEKTPTETPTSKRENGISRRTFLGSSIAGLAAAGTVGVGGLFGAAPRARADLIGPLIGQDRLIEVEAKRLHLIDLMLADGIPPQVCNGDEQTYSDLRATFAKGLSHTFSTGLPNPSNYAQLRAALDSGIPADFENISLAGTRLLVNPQAGLAFDTEGNDPHQFDQPPAPNFSSAETAAEMVELYWMAWFRDTAFTAYGSELNHFAATQELTSLGSAFTGPKESGNVTIQTLFRDDLPGALIGPYISQFMYRDTPFGTEQVDRMMRTVVVGDDHMTTYGDWFDVQEGNVPGQATFDTTRRYIRNGRDLAEWVHFDVLFQAYFNACLILGTPVADGGVGAPFNPGNPYLNSLTQEGFGTWGGPAIKTLLCEVATRALKAVWFQKWFVHRRLRPETFGGRVHVHLRPIVGFPPPPSFDIDSSLLNSQAVDETFNEFGTYLLPMAFPEGSPIHPSYGAGHATVAGACVTVLKAMFDESYPLPQPYWVASGDGLSLQQWQPPTPPNDPLTVGGELNKLASNIATGRSHAGVHYRSDNYQSLLLGEKIAIKVMRDHATLFNEGGDFQFTRFDGTPYPTP